MHPASELNLIKTGRTFHSHYVLLLLFFLLDGYSRYVGLIPITNIFLFFLLTSVAAFLLFLLIRQLNRNTLKAGIFTTFLLAMWLFYGTIQDILLNIPVFHYLAAHRFLIPLLIIFSILIYQWLKKTNHQFHRTTLYFNTALLVFIIIESANITWKLFNKNENSYAVNTLQPIIDCNDCRKPDIYLIVLDEYSGLKVLNEYFNYDNSAFENELKSRGFLVASHPMSNYSSTPISMASTFDMTYLNWGNGKNELQLYAKAAQRISESNGISLLKTLGYSLNNYSIFDLGDKPSDFQTGFLHTKLKLITAKTFPDRIRRDFFWRIQLRNIPIPILSGIFETLDEGNERMIALTNEHASEKHAKPAFIYTHLMMPHKPYVFDSTGGKNVSQFVTEGEIKSAYIQYLVYANRKIVNLIDTILDKTNKEAVILLLSDHGYRDRTGSVKCEELNNNFSAVFIKDQKYVNYYDSISNVNQFRVLFNTLFSQQLQILPDSCVY